MAKLIVVDRARQEAALGKLKKQQAEDPRWQEEEKKMERLFAEEKARRDAEHASKKAEAQQGGG